jgi:hypothetical protein
VFKGTPVGDAAHTRKSTGDFKAPYQQQPLFYFKPMKSASPVLAGGRSSSLSASFAPIFGFRSRTSISRFFFSADSGWLFSSGITYDLRLGTLRVSGRTLSINTKTRHRTSMAPSRLQKELQQQSSLVSIYFGNISLVRAFQPFVRVETYSRTIRH